MILWGISFGIVCAMMCAGIYWPPVCMIIMVVWTINGYILGRAHQSEKHLEELDKMIDEMRKEVEKSDGME